MKNLSDLFKWTRSLPIVDSDGNPVVLGKSHALVLHQRIIGDAELTIARKAALKASRLLRKELVNVDTDTAEALLPDFGDIEDAAVIRMIILAEGLQLRQVARNQATLPKEPKVPKSDAPLEAQEEYEHKLQEHPKEIQKAINEELDVIIKQRQVELEKLSRPELDKLLIRDTVDGLCRTEMLRVFNTHCTYLGTYMDKAMTKRAFTSYEDFENASSELKEQIIGGYIELDISGEDLKN